MHSPNTCWATLPVQFMTAREITSTSPGIQSAYGRSDDMLHGDMLVFGSEIRCLLVPGLPKPKPDYDLLAHFLLLRGLPDDDDRNYFAGIRSVRPGHIVEVTPNRVNDRTYWSFDLAKRIRHKHQGEYVEEFRTRLENAVLRRLRSTTSAGISLSGGLDSSSIFCIAKSRNAGRPGATPDVIGAYMNYGVDSPLTNAPTSKPSSSTTESR